MSAVSYQHAIQRGMPLALPSLHCRCHLEQCPSQFPLFGESSFPQWHLVLVRAQFRCHTLSISEWYRFVLCFSISCIFGNMTRITVSMQSVSSTLPELNSTCDFFSGASEAPRSILDATSASSRLPRSQRGPPPPNGSFSSTQSFGACSANVGILPRPRRYELHPRVRVQFSTGLVQDVQDHQSRKSFQIFYLKKSTSSVTFPFSYSTISNTSSKSTQP